MKLTLYSAPGSIGLATHITLEEINASTALPYELVLLNMKNTEHRSDSYKAINPKARVPSVIVDDVVLTETPAILFYLAQIAPDSAVALPDNPIDIALIQAFNSYLCSTVHIAHAHKYRGNRWVNDKEALAALTANVPNTMKECCESLETNFIKGPWIMGDQYSVCDPYLFAMSAWLEADGVDITQFPKLNHHWEVMNRRNAVKSAFKQIADA